MTELRDYILSKLQERIQQGKIDFPKTTIMGNAARLSAARSLRDIKAMYARSGLAKAPGEPARATKEYIRGNYRLKGDPKPEPQRSSTDLRTQLAYVLADKLEEYRGEKFGYEPGEAPARGEKNPVKTAVGDALSKMRYGTTKPAEVEGGVIKDPGTRGGISTDTRKKLGKLSKTPRWKKIEGIPGMPKLPSRKKEESTNLKDRMVDILMETYRRSGYGSYRSRRKETPREREERENYKYRDDYWSGRTDSQGNDAQNKIAPGGSDEGHKDSPEGHR